MVQMLQDPVSGNPDLESIIKGLAKIPSEMAIGISFVRFLQGGKKKREG